jgi:hypothetical protein
MGLFEHLVGFADAGRRTDVDFEATPLGALDEFEKIFGAFAILYHWSFATCLQNTL